MLEEISRSDVPTSRRLEENPADRRAHPRIPAARLAVTRAHIPNRTSVSLVDLSAGGALFELPFQMQPTSRVGIKLHTAVEQVEVPIQLLRCYVSSLNGGVTYQAAGAFDSLLNVQALAQRASIAARRLIGSLERLNEAVKKTAAHSRHDAAFKEVLTGTMTWLRRGESIDLVALKVKAHVTQTYASLVIVPTTAAPGNQVSSVHAFGLTFTSPHALSVHDRRLLKAIAQLLALLEEARRGVFDEVGADETDSPRIIRSASEWIAAHPRSEEPPLRRPRATAVPVHDSERESAWSAIESMIAKAAVL